MPATAFVHLGLLGRAAAAELVGPSRADELYERSKGHPLFLTELAQQAGRAELPASLVESVSARCDELGPAGAMLRAAAVIGPELDIDLLAALLGRPAVDLLDDAERAVPSSCWPRTTASFRFRHELVREALAASATAGPGRAAAPAGGPGAGPAAARRSGHRSRPRPARRRPGAGRPGAAGRRGRAGRRALRPRGRRGAARRRAAAASRAGGLARPGPGADPPQPATARRWTTSSGPRGRPGGPGGRRLGLLLRPPLRPGRPVRRGRRARRGRRRRPGPAAWRSAAGRGTRPGTWPRPSCCWARPSRWPKGPTG